MIPIAALLNVDLDDDDEEEKNGGHIAMTKAEPVSTLPSSILTYGRQASSASSDEMEEDHDHHHDDSPQEDDEMELNGDQTHTPRTQQHAKREAHKTSSLLGALTLQKLQFASTPPAACDKAAMAPPRAYLTMASLTNPIQEIASDKEEDDGDEDHSTTTTNKPLTPGKAARAARRRSTRALFPGSSEEDRRAKQRMIVKRCYYKKINTINELRDQVQQLEQLFRSVLEERAEEDTKDDKEEEEDAAASAAPGLLDHYVSTVKDKEVLRYENHRLRRLADEQYMKNQGRLRVLLDSNRKDMTLFTPALSDE